MPNIHVKFKIDGERFGVKHRARERGINRNLRLYKYDGNEWNHLESESPDPGSFSDQDLKEWGKQKAEWYL